MNVLFLSTWYPDPRIHDNGSPLVVYYVAHNTLRFMIKHRLYPALARQALGYARTLASWSLRLKWRHKWAQRDALVRTLADFARGRSGRAAWLI